MLDGSDPLDIVRLFAGIVLVGGTVISVVVWLLLGEPRMFELATALWAIYGVVKAVVNGFLAPVTNLPGLINDDTRSDRLMDDSEVRALTDSAKGRAAAARYLKPAMPSADFEARMQEAESQGGTGAGATSAVQALEALRAANRLTGAEDVRVGLALIRLHEERLNDAAGALKEFRRLIALHDDPGVLAQIRASLADISSKFLPAPAENRDL